MTSAPIFRRSFLVLCCCPLLFSGSASTATFSAAAMGLDLGPHPVGFQVIQTHDHSRAFRPTTEFSGDSAGQDWARPIQIILWYPAAVNTGRPVVYRSIVEAEHTQIDFDALNVEELALARKAHDSLMGRNLPGLSEEILDNLWDAQTGSRWDAKPASGPFPLLVWSGNSATYNSILCEVLASQGYVVASAPGIGRWAVEYADPVPNPIHLATQSDDLGFVVDHLRASFPWIDGSRLALAGFSTTNLATLLFQMKNMLADAVVSVEGHDRYASGGRTVPQSLDYDPKRFRIPLLYLEAPAAGHRRDTALFDALKYAPRYLATFPALRHQDLTSRVAALETVAPGISNEAIGNGYRSASRYLLLFLNAFLKKDRQARESLTESPEGASVQIFPAIPPVPSEAEVWASLFEADGVDRLTEIFRAAKRLDPEQEIFSERLLNRAGYALLRRQNIEASIQVFRLYAEAYPTSPNAFDSLSDACAAAGEMAAALAAAEQALALLEQETEMEDGRKERFRSSILEKLEGWRTAEKR